MSSRITFTHDHKNYTTDLIEAAANAPHTVTINSRKYSIADLSEIPPSIQIFMNRLVNQTFEDVEAFKISLNMAVKIDAVFQKAVEKENFRGAALVIRDGNTLLNQGYGIANEHGDKITGKTIFHLGSITKQFTATAILLLEQEGKLHVDDFINMHLPERCRSSKWDQITIHQLLTHTSGLPDFDEEFYSLTTPMTLEEEIETFKDKPLDFSPGTAWNYVNSGYQLLGAIIVQASEMASYEDFIIERILKKCDMNDSGCKNYDMDKASMGYEENEDGTLIKIDNQQAYLLNAYAAGGIYSTTEDMQKWDQALYSDILLTPESKKKMFHPVDLPHHFPMDNRYSIDELTLSNLFNQESYPIMHYGYGVHAVQDPDLGLVISHGGRIAGFATVISRYTERKACIIILSNNGSSNPEELWLHVENILKIEET